MKLAENEVSIDRVTELLNQGLSDAKIYETLKKEGYPSLEIDNAINQARLGNPMAEENLDDAPEPGLRPSLLNQPQSSDIQTRSTGFSSNFNNDILENSSFQNTRSGVDEVEALIESIIEEKWKNTLQRFGNLDVWRERVKTDVVSIKQELIRLEHRFENIEKAIIGKVSQYDKNIVNIGNEMKVLEQVFQKIITPLTNNIKELGKITKELKEK